MNKYPRLKAALSALGQGLFALLVLLAVSFISLPPLALLWRAWRTEAWAAPLDERVGQAIRLSLETSLYSMALVILLGTPLAYVLAHYQFWGRGPLNVLLELPIVLPPAVAGLGLLMAFGRRGLLGPGLDDLGLRIAFTQMAVVLAQTFVALPFYTRAAQMGFQAVDPEILSAAQVDGADAFGRFRLISLPLARRALLGGLLMSWARALGEFGATILFAGSLPGRTQTMTLLIYNLFEQDLNAAIWTALLLIALAAGIIGLTRWLAVEEASS